MKFIQLVTTNSRVTYEVYTKYMKVKSPFKCHIGSNRYRVNPLGYPGVLLLRMTDPFIRHTSFSFVDLPLH